MGNFKMKDLMIRIQPESPGRREGVMKTYHEDLPAELYFGTCTSPSCATPSTCSHIGSCKPTQCPDGQPKPPKPKPKHNDKLGGGMMELDDLKKVLAEMQIRLARNPEASEMFE
jgi:hypothetical protein